MKEANETVFEKGFNLQVTHVFIGHKKNQLAARIRIDYWPGFTETWMIEDVLNRASTLLASHIANYFDELEKTKS